MMMGGWLFSGSLFFYCIFIAWICKMEHRKIIHIDMDAFYASVEQRDHPELRGKPVAVGGSSERGVIAAASYEAREFGVRSAMPSAVAKKRCPELLFVKSSMSKYKEISEQIRQIFFEYTDLVEPLSIDEAFLDVSKNKKGIPSATLIAEEIRKRIKEETALTASAGVSINKFLAKIASDRNKPNGIFVIPPDAAETFVEKLPVEDFFGVGKVTADKMHKLGLFFGKDIKAQSLDFLVRHFGKAGEHYYKISRTIDERPVNPDRQRKSVGAERTFEKDLYTKFEHIAQLYHIEKELIERIKTQGFKGYTLTLKIKYSNFTQITRSKTFPQVLNRFSYLHPRAKELLLQKEIEQPVRLLGLSVSNEHENSGPLQLTLDF